MNIIELKIKKFDFCKNGFSIKLKDVIIDPKKYEEVYKKTQEIFEILNR